MTPLSVPFVHNRIPGTFMKSYLEWIKMDYYRLPGYGTFTRGDIMVFNWPVGDSVLLHNDVIAHDYYSFVRNQSLMQFYQKNGMQGTGTEKQMLEFNNVAPAYMKATREHLLNGGELLQLQQTGNGTLSTTIHLKSTKGMQTLT